MLLVGCPKTKVLDEEIIKYNKDHKQQFTIKKTEGLNLHVNHTFATDIEAKQVMKDIIAQSASLRRIFSSIKIIDEKGAIQ